MPDRKAAGGGGGSGSSRDKWRLRKRSSRLTIQPLFTITEEEEVQRHRQAGRRKKQGMKEMRLKAVLCHEASLVVHKCT